jgi:peptidoglycan/LPS O-acetylase OafA/YrhL
MNGTGQERAWRGPTATDRRRGTSSTGLDRGRSSGLDGLRALSCVAVVIYHLQLVSGIGFGPLDPLVKGGTTGVWVFFALSAYLLYKPFLQRSVDLRSFAIKRIARIVPGYYAALIGLAILTGTQLPVEHPLLFIGMAASYDIPLRGFLGNAWTLSAEILFYLTLPLIAWLARGREVAVLGALAMASMVAAIWHRATLSQSTEWLSGTYPLAFYAFVPGMLLALLEVRRPDVFREFGRLPYLVFGLVCVGIGALTEVLPIAIGAAVGTPMIMGWVLHHRMPGARFLTFAGGASYALYLWHKDLLIVFGPGGLVIAVVASAVSWALIERPVLARAHWLADTWRARRAPSPAIPAVAP